MVDEGLISPDGAAIARSVRSLARQAGRLLTRPADEAEACELLAAIEGLERVIEPGASGDLGRWLASLRRRIEARLMAVA